MERVVKKAKGMIAALGVAALVAGFAFMAPVANAAVATIPGAPTSLSATPGNTTVSLSWTAPVSNGGSAVTGYNVYEGTSSGGENYSSPVNGGTLVTSTTMAVTGLTNATTYYFTVKAVNAIGSSAASNEAWAIPAATVPGAPTHVVATAGDVSATVTWSAPSDPGGSNITSYTVTAADSTLASRGGQTCIWTTGALTCTVTGLTNGDSYTFTVTATNSLGTSAASPASNAVVPVVTAPSAPTNIVATPGNTTVALSWAAPANGGSAITGYNVYEGTSSGGESGTAVNTTLITTTTTTVTGLTNGTTYYFTIKAVNAIGSSAASTEVWAIPAGTVPGAPTGVTATVGFGSVTVTWAAPSDVGGSAIIRYTVATADSTAPGRGGQTCTWTTGPLTCTVTGLTNGDSYTFTVTATNTVGTSVASSVSNAVVPGLSVPSAPTGLAATPGNHKVVLSWVAPPNGGAAIIGYNLYEGTSAGGENYSAPVNGGVLISGITATVTGLTNGDTYYFTVKAVNDVGSSVASNEAWAIPAQTAAGAPQNVDATAGINGSVAVSWVTPLNSGGSIITGYVVTPYIGTTVQGSVVFHTTATTETLTGLSPGRSYSFTVAAINASGNGASSAPSNVVTVPRAYTILALSLSARTVTYGNEQVESFSVVVSPNYPGPVPTGTVSIKKSTTTLCVITLSSAKGSCRLTGPELPPRTFSVYATYAPNTSFVGSGSFKTKTLLTVAKASTKTALKLSAARVTFGDEQVERLSVSVSPQYSGAIPTGAVTISGTSCVIKLSSGKGSCTPKAKTFAVGSHALVAHYWGSQTYNGSLSGRDTLSAVK
jgi:predicted RNA-binding protein with TRAM domain